jgi:hypothetical protein
MRQSASGVHGALDLKVLIKSLLDKLVQQEDWTASRSLLRQHACRWQRQQRCQKPMNLHGLLPE